MVNNAVAATLLQITKVFFAIAFEIIFALSVVCMIFFILTPPFLLSIISTNNVKIYVVTNSKIRRLTVDTANPCIASQYVLKNL